MERKQIEKELGVLEPRLLRARGVVTDLRTVITQRRARLRELNKQAKRAELVELARKVYAAYTRGAQPAEMDAFGITPLRLRSLYELESFERNDKRTCERCGSQTHYQELRIALPDQSIYLRALEGIFWECNGWIVCPDCVDAAQDDLTTRVQKYYDKLGLAKNPTYATDLWNAAIRLAQSNARPGAITLFRSAHLRHRIPCAQRNTYAPLT